jgi:FkbM family methyltransferase
MSNLILSLAALTARLLPSRLSQVIYRVPPLSHLLRSALNKAAPVGLTEIEVAGGGLSGARFLLNLQSEKDYWLGTYEPELQTAIQDLVQLGMSAYDVGANIGYITLLLARAVGTGGQVIAFEALPGNLERLRTNIALNGLESRIQVVPKGVCDSSRQVHFQVHSSGGMGKVEGSAGREIDYQETLSVPGICLDDFVYIEKHPPPEVVKMDIEGGEVLALPGMVKVLDEARPLLLLELHGPESAQKTWDTLTTRGYSIHLMTTGYPQVSSPQELDWKSYLVARWEK